MFAPRLALPKQRGKVATAGAECNRLVRLWVVAIGLLLLSHGLFWNTTKELLGMIPLSDNTPSPGPLVLRLCDGYGDHKQRLIQLHGEFNPQVRIRMEGNELLVNQLAKCPALTTTVPDSPNVLTIVVRVQEIVIVFPIERGAMRHYCISINLKL